MTKYIICYPYFSPHDPHPYHTKISHPHHTVQYKTLQTTWEPDPQWYTGKKKKKKNFDSIFNFLQCFGLLFSKATADTVKINKASTILNNILLLFWFFHLLSVFCCFFHLLTICFFFFFQEIPFQHIWSGNQNNLHCSFSLEMMERGLNKVSCKIQVYQKAILSNRQVLNIFNNFKEVGTYNFPNDHFLTWNFDKVTNDFILT